MFNFGDPMDTARLSWDYALKAKGPAVPSVPYDELEEQDLRNMLAYLHISVGNAQEQGASDEVMEILVNEYDHVFQLLAEGSDEFRESVRKGRHFPATGTDQESVEKYNRLAGV